MSARSYGQFCAIARALDVVGDRWTLLIVRELLFGPRTFASLEGSLLGISSTLLSERLVSLRAAGLIERNDAPQRSKTVTYRLTEQGAGLEPVLLAMLRWGGQWMVTGPGDDHIEPAWTGLALKALLDGTPAALAEGRRVANATVHVEVDGVTTTIQLRKGRRVVQYGALGRADTTVHADLMAVLPVASGLLPYDAVELVVEGDAFAAQAALRP